MLADDAAVKEVVTKERLAATRANSGINAGLIFCATHKCVAFKKAFEKIGPLPKRRKKTVMQADLRKRLTGTTRTNVMGMGTFLVNAGADAAS